MGRNILLLLMIMALAGCASSGPVQNRVNSTAADAGPAYSGVSHSREISGSSQGFVRGNGTIQRSTRVPGGYPHYHYGYPARGGFSRQYHDRSEHHHRPRARFHYHNDNLHIRGEW